MIIPSFIKTHYSELSAFNYRVKKIRELIDQFKVDPNLIIFTKRILGKLDPPRERYDYQCSERIFLYLKTYVPFRKDVVSVETIQYPQITLKYGGDCDDFCVTGGSMLESVGIETKLAVSKQYSNDYDHIFIFIPSIQQVFDVTAPIPYNVVNVSYYKDVKLL